MGLRRINSVVAVALLAGAAGYEPACAFIFRPPDATSAASAKTLRAPSAATRIRATGARSAPAPTAVARESEPVVTATTAGPGQSGYVHYFVIEKPDKSLETQIGIELPDRRIAWSFPELGVAVSPFIEAGPLEVNGKIYRVEHLYGIRPFPDDESMRALQRDLARRIVPWVEDETPHCDSREPAGPLCISCLGFAMRVLFPGRTPEYPALPRDFEHAGSGGYYTTEDLLLYLAGLHGLSREARLRRIDEAIPLHNLREDLRRLVHAADSNDTVGSADVDTPRNLFGINGSGARSSPRVKPPRGPQRRKL